MSPATAAARLSVRKLDFWPDAESAFVHIYGESSNAFWLDSAAVGERGRFSFMGDSEGPLAAVLTYDVWAGRLRVERGGRVETREESIFDYLERELARLRPPPADLPFDFDCGFAGYLGYELKAECDGSAAHRAATHDAALVLADRLIAFDHDQGRVYLVALVGDDGEEEAERWFSRASACLRALPALAEPEASPRPLELRLRRSHERYRRDIEACQAYLRAGHSYEICLTNRAVADAPAEPLELYRALRRANPAPFGAFLRFGGLSVLSSSPERLLAVDRRRWAETRPIKGTARRGATAGEDVRLAAALRADAKARAENVTIVDLMRNDLGRVCEAGTVEVPELMRVETYETVHQLVSSVRGRLREDVGAVECLRACFPPGSMTGAPKRRTMEIIDELEGEARGPYAGAIGYLGLGGGCDLSVAIRTIVADGATIEVGAGGAIVVDSDPDDEFEEMLLKARAPISAFAPEPHF